MRKLLCLFGIHRMIDTVPDCLWGWNWRCERCGQERQEGVMP